jgi:hypothetical protein
MIIDQAKYKGIVHGKCFMIHTKNYTTRTRVSQDPQV